MLEWKIKKLIHDNADKGRIKLSGMDTSAFSPHSPHFQSHIQVWSEKDNSTYFQKNKKENLKYKLKRIPHTISEEITKQGLL